MPKTKDNAQNYENTDEIVCPYCDFTHSDSWEFGEYDGIKLCDNCDKGFFVTVRNYTEYSTHTKESKSE